jgi:hypothetical protein
LTEHVFYGAYDFDQHCVVSGTSQREMEFGIGVYPGFASHYLALLFY